MCFHVSVENVVYLHVFVCLCVSVEQEVSDVVNESLDIQQFHASVIPL